jgi:hypothetical protein
MPFFVICGLGIPPMTKARRLMTLLSIYCLRACKLMLPLLLKAIVWGSASSDYIISC